LLIPQKKHYFARFFGLNGFMNSMELYTTTLPCGLRVVQSTSPTDVVYCGFFINAGTRDEREEENGIAHFCEHLSFKGTHRRRSWHILNRLEQVGGDLNAYTNKEETVYHAAVLKEHYARAIDLLADIVWHSTFPQKELEKEREVVQDEIALYQDSPSELIFDDFENLIFSGNALGRNILGTPDSLNRFRSEDARSFCHRYYTPENMVFFFLGNVSHKQVVRELEKAVDRSPLEHTGLCTERTAPMLYTPQQVEMDKDTHQAHVLLGNRCYNAYDNRRIGLYLLSNILGGPGMNSRLNVSLREKRGLVYTAESNHTFYTDTGAFCIYFGCDAEDVNRCLNLTYKELKKLRDTPLTGLQLDAAKRQIKGQIGVSLDNLESQALTLGKSFLRYGRGRDIEKLYHQIDALTAGELQEIANEVLDEDKMTRIVYK
jgi:predicted Zn-dependent peptidase